MVKPCKHCGGQVATTAKACPHCGAPARLGFSVTRTLLLLGIVLGVLYWLVTH